MTPGSERGERVPGLSAGFPPGDGAGEPEGVRAGAQGLRALEAASRGEGGLQKGPFGLCLPLALSPSLHHTHGPNKEVPRLGSGSQPQPQLQQRRILSPGLWAGVEAVWARPCLTWKNSQGKNGVRRELGERLPGSAQTAAGVQAGEGRLGPRPRPPLLEGRTLHTGAPCVPLPARRLPAACRAGGQAPPPASKVGSPAPRFPAGRGSRLLPRARDQDRARCRRGKSEANAVSPPAGRRTRLLRLCGRFEPGPQWGLDRRTEGPHLLSGPGPRGARLPGRPAEDAWPCCGLKPTTSLTLLGLALPGPANPRTGAPVTCGPPVRPGAELCATPAPIRTAEQRVRDAGLCPPLLLGGRHCCLCSSDEKHGCSEVPRVSSSVATASEGAGPPSHPS